MADAKEEKKYSETQVRTYLLAQKNMLLKAASLQANYSPRYGARLGLLETIHAAKDIPRELWDGDFLWHLNKLERILGVEETKK